MAVAACWERDPAAGEEWHELLPGGSLRVPFLTRLGGATRTVLGQL